jgi:hypothetical protein
VPVKWVAGVAAAAILVVAIVLTCHHDSKPAEVKPVPHATTPAQEARNLETWLRRYSG